LAWRAAFFHFVPSGIAELIPPKACRPPHPQPLSRAGAMGDEDLLLRSSFALGRGMRMEWWMDGKSLLDDERKADF